jgi:hypothetical protein
MGALNFSSSSANHCLPCSFKASRRTVASTLAACSPPKFRHAGAGNSGDHLGPVLRNPPVLIPAANHEPGDVLQEKERDAALRTKLDEVGALLRRFPEQNPVVRDDADRVSVDVREARDERDAVSRLEFVEPAAVR